MIQVKSKTSGDKGYIEYENGQIVVRGTSCIGETIGRYTTLEQLFNEWEDVSSTFDFIDRINGTKFLIYRTYGGSPRKYCLAQKGFNIKYIDEDEDGDLGKGEITLYSLKDLLDLLMEIKEELIIGYDKEDNIYTIEIYDDYRE